MKLNTITLTLLIRLKWNIVIKNLPFSESGWRWNRSLKNGTTFLWNLNHGLPEIYRSRLPQIDSRLYPLEPSSSAIGPTGVTRSCWSRRNCHVGSNRWRSRQGFVTIIYNCHVVVIWYIVFSTKLWCHLWTMFFI